MELDETCTRRDYLYGRLLAVAEVAESVALNKKEGNDARITNARRYFTAFVNQPYRTWNVIRQRLEPYLSAMPKT
ncbi:MAG: type I-C CRISPR-associated protein Cas8c/Csd1, partial [Ruminococcus sp.]